MTGRFGALLAIVALVAAGGVTPAVAQPCICLTCMFGTAEAFRAGSASMMPAIAPEACLVVDTSPAARETAAPGDIVAYRRGEGDAAMLFLTRIVATGGQTVQMRGGRVVLDGNTLPAEDVAPLVSPSVIPADRCPSRVGDACRVRRLRETLPNGVSYEVLDLLVGGLFDDTAAVTVPEGHVFGLADNRDNAVDSRMDHMGSGPIARDEIVGRVTSVAATP